MVTPVPHNPFRTEGKEPWRRPGGPSGGPPPLHHPPHSSRAWTVWVTVLTVVTATACVLGYGRPSPTISTTLTTSSLPNAPTRPRSAGGVRGQSARASDAVVGETSARVGTSPEAAEQAEQRTDEATWEEERLARERVRPEDKSYVNLFPADVTSKHLIDAAKGKVKKRNDKQEVLTGDHVFGRDPEEATDEEETEEQKEREEPVVDEPDEPKQAPEVQLVHTEKMVAEVAAAEDEKQKQNAQDNTNPELRDSVASAKALASSEANSTSTTANNNNNTTGSEPMGTSEDASHEVDSQPAPTVVLPREDAIRES
jgi:hypothetical protein